MLRHKDLQEFIDRDLEDFEVLKACEPEEFFPYLDSIYSIPFEFKTTPFLHQLVGFYIGTTEDEFIFRFDMGTGKTKLAIDMIAFKKAQELIHRTLVVTSKLVNVAGWCEEVKIHSDLSAIGILAPEKQEKISQLEADADIFIMDYTTLQTLMCDFVPDPDKPGKNMWAMNQKQIKAFGRSFDMVVLDELHVCRNRDSLRYKTCKLLTSFIPLRYGLTGTLFGRNPLVAWPQFYLVDKGFSLGDNFYVFREAMCKEVYNHFTFNKRELVFDKDKLPLFKKMISNRCLSYSLIECRDIPPRSDIVKVLPFALEQKRYYDNAIKGIIDAGEDRSLISSAFIQMRQISSGFLRWQDADGEHLVDFDQNPKMDFLLALIDSLDEEEKMIVFTEFTHSGEMLTKTFKKEKIESRWLYGGTKDKVKTVSDFVKKPDVRVLVANSASGATGLNLQVAHYVVFFESPVDPIIRDQAERRAWARGDSQDKVFFYDLVMAKSIENKVLSYVKEGKDLHAEIMRVRPADGRALLCRA